MSPNIEPAVGSSRYTLRHIGPRAAVWATSPNANTAVLNQSEMVARPLPTSSLPTSPDFVSGTWNGRLGDAGDATLVFPNTTSSDGVPYRERFSAAGHNEFIEIRDNGVVDFVGVIDQVTVSQQQVTVHCSDGWFLLKKAYERDWTVVQAPRDVIERATQVWVPTTVDDFPVGSTLVGSVLTTPTATWTALTDAGGAVALEAGGGVAFTVTGTSADARIYSSTVTLGAETGVWRASCSLQYAQIASNSGLSLAVTESGTDQLYVVALFEGQASFQSGTPAGFVVHAVVPFAATYTLLIESDGEWVWGFCNGQQFACCRRSQVQTASLSAQVELAGNGTASTAILSGVLLESLQPFLMAGDDVGDRSLPGTARACPTAGLRPRFG